MQARRPWEKSYPAGVRWDTPIPTSTLPALFDDFTARYAANPALEYRGRTTTFAELRTAVAGAAAGFVALGVAPRTPVALYLPNTPYHPIAFFAAATAGAPLVHLSPLDAERELAHKLKDSGARLLVTTNVGLLLPMALGLLRAGLLDRIIVGDDTAFGTATLPTTAIPREERVRDFGDLLAAGRERPRERPPVAPEDLALLQYTGGTTGKPKAAMLTHANLTAACAIYKAWSDPQRLSEPGEEKIICVLPLFHIYALTAVMLRGLSEGNELLLRLRFDLDTTLRDIEEKKATAFAGVPTMWIALANAPGIEKRDFSSLRHAASGGAPLPVDVERRIWELTGQRLGGGWGMTETSPAGTVMPREATHKRGSVGVPLPGIDMEIVALDDPRRVLGPGEHGEIRIKGPNVTRGYWNAPEETARAFADGFLLTGDIGYLDEDGFFYLVDRKKDMIICGGFNVYPRALEEAIYEHPAVAEVCVIGVPDAYRGETPKAFVQLKPGSAAFTLEELRGFLADKLGRHELPTQLEFRAELPKTAVGKLSKKELAAEERHKLAAGGRLDALP
jgi:long-chain acyl-CoA synthetase